jgi:hypothetical protein
MLIAIEPLLFSQIIPPNPLSHSFQPRLPMQLLPNQQFTNLPMPVYLMPGAYPNAMSLPSGSVSAPTAPMMRQLSGTQVTGKDFFLYESSCLIIMMVCGYIAAGSIKI